MLFTVGFFPLILIYALQWRDQDCSGQNFILLSRYVKHVSSGILLVGTSSADLAENMPDRVVSLPVFNLAFLFR
jgi:hypothetical protein